MLKKLLLLAASTAVALLVAEVTCRLVLWPSTEWWPRGMYVASPDPAIAFRLAPNFDGVVRNRHEYPVRTNSLGFRSAEPRPDSARTLAVFGDSFAFGQGVSDDETFPAVIERGLEGEGYQVVNTGVCAYSPAQEYRIYREFVERAPLDVVVIQLFENDILDQSAPPVQGVYDGHLYNRPPATAAQVAGLWVLRHSELASHTLYQVKYGAWRESVMPDYLAADYEAVHAREIESTRALLLEWLAEAVGRGQRVLVLWVPRREQVDPGLSERFEAWARAGKAVDVDADRRWLEPRSSPACWASSTWMS